jgi:TP901 family phage tail tape measure protein
MADLRGSIKALSRTSREFSGLQRIREDAVQLGQTLGIQKAELEKVKEELARQRSAHAALDQTIDKARASVLEATAAHAASRQELERERAAIEALRKPSQEQIALLQRQRAELKDLENAKKSAARVALGAQGTLDGKRQYLATLLSGVSTREANLSALTAAGASAPEIARLTRELEQQRAKARELADAMHIYEVTARDTAGAAEVAAQRFDRMNRMLIDQKVAMSAASEAQNRHLNELEEKIRASSEALDAAKKSEKEATEAKKAHTKEALENKKSLELLERKETELASSIASTENRIESATEASERHTKSLEKQGHEVNDLTEAQRLHAIQLAKTQALEKRQEEINRLQARAHDLRSQAMSHFYFTLGSGFIFTAPIREAVAFEKAMIRVKAMTGANAEEFSRLKKQARDLGASTIFTAKEAAEAQNELATAGYRTSDIIAVMPSMLALAESSMTSLARTAEITSEVLQGFNLDVSQMARVGDSLTAAYLGSASSLESLGEMLKYVAASSVDVGSSLEQTLAASSVLHNSGVKGSMAGTTMRAIFLRMAKPPKELRKILEEMHISMKDKDGNLRDWMEILGEMNVRLKGVGSAKRAAVSKALGGEEHAPGASILLRSQADGSLRLMQRTFELAPAYNAMSKSLLKMSDKDLRATAEGIGIKVNRAMSGGGILAAISGSLKGLKGSALDAQMETIFSRLNLGPKIEDMKAEEFSGKGKAVDAALKRLNISRIKALGGTKTADELTQEIRTQIQMLPMEEQLKYIEIFFSRTRTGVADLMKEFARSGKNFDQLLKALEESQTMEKTRKELSTSTAAQLDEVRSAMNDIMISFGEAFIPILRDMIVWLKPILNGFGEWIKANKELAKNIMLGVGSIFAFNGAMALLKFSFSGLIDLVRAGKTVGKWFGPGTAGASGMRWLRTGAGIGMNYLTEGLGLLWSKSGVKKGWGKGKSLGRWSGRLLKGGTLRGWSGLLKTGPLLSGAVRAVGAAMMGLGPVGWGIAAAAIAIAAGGYLIWKNWGTIGPKLQKMWIGIRETALKAWTSIANGIGAAWDWVKEKISGSGWLEGVWEKFTGFFKHAYEAIKPYIKVMFPWIDSTVDAVTAFPQWISDAWDAGKKDLSGVFSMPDTVKVPAALERVGGGSGSYTQRNVITVNATIHVDPGASAPREVASKIKSEIQAAFRSAPSFSFLDPVELS